VVALAIEEGPGAASRTCGSLERAADATLPRRATKRRTTTRKAIVTDSGVNGLTPIEGESTSFTDAS
jgi:hypothetical protein